jgi:small-conductance mechanosensitive channel
MAEKLPPLDNLLARLIQDSHRSELLVQLGLLALSIALGWLAVRALKPRLGKFEETWSAGAESMQRVGLPVAILVAVFLTREGLRFWQSELHLLNLALPLLTALVLVRLLIYALRSVLKPGDRLTAWERGIAWLIWIGMAMHITGVLPRVRAAMATVAFESGTHRFSLLLLFEAVTVVIAAIIFALWAAQFIESRLMRVPHMDLSLRMALSKAARTVFLVLAVLVALPAVGIDLTVLSVFGGALGVGLGFGLQKVASNYVSGFIILLDRSVRMGDMITVDNKYGQVTEMNTRYTLIRSQDGTESIVPNEMLIIQTVVNHSLSKPDIRVALPIQVSYATDLTLAREIMMAAAKRHPRVLSVNGEGPNVLIREFADNGINLELAIWIKDAEEGQLALRSELYWDIWDNFKKAAIEIPYPQRVIHTVEKTA